MSGEWCCASGHRVIHLITPNPKQILAIVIPTMIIPTIHHFYTCGHRVICFITPNPRQILAIIVIPTTHHFIKTVQPCLGVLEGAY